MQEKGLFGPVMSLSLLCCSIMQLRAAVTNYTPRLAWTYFIIICKNINECCIYLQGNLDFIQSSCELCWKPHGQPDTIPVYHSIVIILYVTAVQYNEPLSLSLSISISSVKLMSYHDSQDLFGPETLSGLLFSVQLNNWLDLSAFFLRVGN